jgi:hypothetical protein
VKIMYSDQSSNPITALQGVDMLLDPLQAGFVSAFAPAVSYGGTGISVAEYNALVSAYNQLLDKAEGAVSSLRREASRLRLENVRLQAENNLLRRAAGK